MLVAEHLNFDMARVDDEFLDEHPIVAERGLRLGFGAGEAFGDLLPGMGDAHALAAAARRGLDHDGIADLVGDPSGVLGRFDHAEIAGDGRHLGGVGEFLRLDLVAHRFDRARVRADEDDPRVGERLRERRALGEEAVAGMHRLRARLLGGGDDLLDHEIGLGRRGRPDRDRLVGHFDVQRVLVGLRIDRDGRDPHPARGLDDPARDLAAIGDQDFLEHRPPGSKAQCGPARLSVLGEWTGPVHQVGGPEIEIAFRASGSEWFASACARVRDRLSSARDCPRSLAPPGAPSFLQAFPNKCGSNAKLFQGIFGGFVRSANGYNGSKPEVAVSKSLRSGPPTKPRPVAQNQARGYDVIGSP